MRRLCHHGLEDEPGSDRHAAIRAPGSRRDTHTAGAARPVKTAPRRTSPRTAGDRSLEARRAPPVRWSLCSSMSWPSASAEESASGSRNDRQEPRRCQQYEPEKTGNGPHRPYPTRRTVDDRERDGREPDEHRITGPFSSTPAATAVHRIAGWVQPIFVSGSRWLAR